MKTSIQQTILPFQLKETNDCMTSRSGLAVYFEAAIRYGIPKKIREIFPKSGSNRGISAHDIIMSLILMLLSGGRHLNDVREIAADKGLLKLCGIKKVPSPDAIARFLDKKSHLRRMNFLIDFLNNQILAETKLNNITVDIDATLLESKKRDAVMTYKGFKGFSVLTAFESSLGLCLACDFRGGSVHAGEGFLEQTKRINKMMKKLEKQLKKVRSDSAAYDHENLDYCSDEGIFFSITADKDSSIMDAITSIPDREWKPLYDKYDCLTDRQHASIVHSMNETKNAFTVVVQRWKNKQLDLFEQDEYCYYAISVNDFDSDERTLILDHNQRGNVENFIKEQKYGLNMDYIPTADMYSNSVYFAIGALAYNLTIAFKNYLPEDFKKAGIATMRYYLISTPGKIVEHGRQFVLKVQKHFFKFIDNIRRRLALQILTS